MADEEVELTEEQRQVAQLEESLQTRMPRLSTVEDYNVNVRDDVENLVVVALVSKQCPHSLGLRAALNSMSRPRPSTKNARFFRLDVQDVPDVALQLGISSVPAIVFLLKGVSWHTHVGRNDEKITGHLRNFMIKRNEVMREYDLAKVAKPEDENDGGEEGEEGGADEGEGGEEE